MARSRLAIAFTLIGTVLSSAAQAMGLGAIEAKSNLNQPLNARIPLIAAEPGEIDSLIVTLAKADAFERAGVTRAFNLTRLKFQVVKGDKPFILVTSTQPIKEPFLDFLIEASWSKGRMVREFTLLLDPPVYSSNAKATAPAIAAAQAGGAAPKTPSAPGQQPSGMVATAPSLPPAAGPSAGTVQEYGPVKASDTLWKVASHVRPDGATVEQTMVGLLKANPHAFIDGDMNRLKRGQVLRVPDAGALNQVGAAEAAREVRAQIARWQRSQTEATGADSAGSSSSEQGQAHLKVVAPAQSGGEQATSSLLNRDIKPTPETVSKLQNELKLSEETNASLKAENEELKEQVEALKQGVAGQQDRPVNIQVEQPVVGQQPQQPAAAQTPETQPAQAETPAAQPVDQPPAAEAQPAEQPATPAETQTPPAQAEQKPEQKPVEAAKPAQPAAEPGLLDDPKNIGFIAGVIAILAALGYLIWRRRSRADEPEAAPVVVAAEPEPEPEAEPEVAEDLEPAPAASAADQVPESDVASEADVYLAYGRYDQAQDVVAKALQQDAGRADLRLKLMEILALTQNRAEFENQAALLRDQVGEADPLWARAVEMGREIAPDSALFDGSAAAPAVDETAEAEAPAADLDLGDLNFDAAPAAEPEVAFEAEPEVAAEPDFAIEAEAPAEEAPAADLGLDFDLPAAEAPAEVAEDDALAFEPAAEEPVIEAPADAGLDFDLADFKLDKAAPAEDNVVDFSVADEPEAAVAEQPEAAADEIPLEGLDEVSTKLDLARAYLDMGDAEGARSLLDEVMAEGNARQKTEAEALMKKIA